MLTSYLPALTVNAAAPFLSVVFVSPFIVTDAFLTAVPILSFILRVMFEISGLEIIILSRYICVSAES